MVRAGGGGVVGQLVADADVRGALLDELAELAAFLRCRAAGMGSAHGASFAAMAASAPAALHGISLGSVTAWLQVPAASLTLNPKYTSCGVRAPQRRPCDAGLPPPVQALPCALGSMREACCTLLHCHGESVSPSCRLAATSGC